jgi:hypothetical protein
MTLIEVSDRPTAVKNVYFEPMEYAVDGIIEFYESDEVLRFWISKSDFKDYPELTLSSPCCGAQMIHYDFSVHREENHPDLGPDLYCMKCERKTIYRREKEQALEGDERYLEWLDFHTDPLVAVLALPIFYQIKDWWMKNISKYYHSIAYDYEEGIWEAIGKKCEDFHFPHDLESTNLGVSSIE